MRFPQVGDEFGRYRLDRILGQGGMGIVFAATDTRLNRTVALKVITGALAESEEFRQRFQHEAAALAQLDSPHVIAIYDHDEIDGTPYIATQFVDGADLWTLLDERGAMPARTALTLAAQIARGLDDAHRRGVIHRDVKPGNVLLRGADTRDVHAYLCDFGIARADGISGPAPTATGMVAGTWSYLAPERATGEPATAASDLYALGCVLWTCLTGSAPYTGTEVEVALAHVQAPVPQLPPTSAFANELNGILARLLAKDPADRYADAAAARADLERLAAAAPGETLAPAAVVPATVVRRGSAGSPPAASPAATGKNKWPLAVAAVVVLTIVGGGAAWAATRGGDESGPKKEDKQAAVDLVSGDFDGNGYGDVLVQQSEFDDIAPSPLWSLPSTGKMFGSPVQHDAELGDARSGDVDGDGRLEVVWIDYSKWEDPAMKVIVAPAEGEPREQEITLDPAYDIATYSTVVTDITGDGLDDLVFPTDPAEATDSVYVAESSGTEFGEVKQWYRSEFEGGWTWPGDFDGDGTSELLYIVEPSGSDKSEMRILTADGEDLVPGKSRRLGGPGQEPSISNWLTGDVDGDGADEIVNLSARGRAIYVWEVVDGEVQPSEKWTYRALSEEQARDHVYDNGLAAVTLSDVDGDGDDDLVDLVAPNDDLVIEVKVRLADGREFADPVDWGSVTCGGGCEDSFQTLD